MPYYDFKCPKCGQVYEVSRPMSRATDPLACLIDKTPCERVLTMPATFVKSDSSSSEAMAESAPPPAPGDGLGHGHSHGPGSHMH